MISLLIEIPSPKLNSAPLKHNDLFKTDVKTCTDWFHTAQVDKYFPHNIKNS